MKPFIKLFQTPNKYYCFDAPTGTILNVDNDMFKLLRDSLENDGIDLAKAACELKKEGYLMEGSPIKHIDHKYTEYIPDLLQRQLSNMILQVTQGCNFRCKYCVYSEDKNNLQRGHSSKQMNWSVAKKAIDFLWERSVDSKYIRIGFYGGEPLLNFLLIKRTIEYCEERFSGKSLLFNLTTNGSLLNKEMMLFFAEHHVTVMISLDGPKRLNDENRVFANGKGTYDSVISNIKLAHQVVPDWSDTMKLSMVMDPQNDLDEINLLFSEEEFRNFDDNSLTAAIVSDAFDDNKTIISENFIEKSAYQEFLAVLFDLGHISDENVSLIAKQSWYSKKSIMERMQSTTPLFETDAPGGPCIPGHTRLFCNVEGKLYPCERVSELSESMCIGDIENGFYLPNVSQLLNVGQIRGDVCKECWCFRFCSICATGVCDSEGKLSADKKEESCLKIKAQMENYMYESLLYRELLER